MNGPEETSAVFSMAHLIYIPLCIAAGGVLGWLLGGRSAQGELTRLRELLARSEEQAAARRLKSSQGS